MTEQMLRDLLVKVHGSETVEVPIFDIDSKQFTRDEKQKESQEGQKQVA